MTDKGGTALVWFRQDLRLADNPALHQAIADHQHIVPVFIYDTDTAGAWATGAAGQWWLHHALADLQHGLQRRKTALVLRRGRWHEVLPKLVAEAGAVAVHAAQMAEPWARAADDKIAALLQDKGVALHRHLSNTLYPADLIRSQSGSHYEVYGAFRRNLLQQAEPNQPIPAPSKISSGADLASDPLDDWALLPHKPDWSGGFREAWRPSEAEAHRLLDHFLDDGLDDYPAERNHPAGDGTSRLSPFFQWGQLSPRQAWARANRADTKSAGAQLFKDELIWREFAAYVLHHRPEMPDRALQKKYLKFPWRHAKSELAAWQAGRTGVPIVDAGMRQLWHTGWMHNRVRMITGSFLVKHLLLPWQQGEKWFWDTLVDANLASNALNWQWVAGTGADPQPFFRIFNPLLQGKKFDPDGDYVRKWVPELAALPNKYIHAPWTAPESVLAAAKITLGDAYPTPLVDLGEGRTRALAALKSLNN